jgi:hypothetical protein
LIYVCAFLPRAGESLLAIEGRNPKEVVPTNTIVDHDRVSGTLAPDRIHDILYHDCSAADVSESTARQRPQALAPFATPIHLTSARFGRVPRAYVECTEDRALALEMQRDMISKSAPVTVRTLPSSHSPFLSMPDRLAQALIELVPAATASR